VSSPVRSLSRVSQGIAAALAVLMLGGCHSGEAMMPHSDGGNLWCPELSVG
jgi:hypothetical protein